jgi:hypothetical protein
MKRIYSILLLGAVAMTVTSCFDGNKFLRFFNFVSTKIYKLTIKNYETD